MKYFGFLARYVVVPLAAVGLLTWWDARRGKRLPPSLNALPAEAVLAAHVAIAIAYTTPWDNYLVASRVWWYDRKLISGLVLGYVPIEEYSFFVLQTLLTGSYVLALARNLPDDTTPPKHPLRVRVGLTLSIAAVWLWAVVNLFRGPRKLRYLTITLSWALIPIMFQTAFGGDILWQHRRLAALGIIPVSLYLGWADTLPIEAGTWSISEEQTINLLVGGKLPFEEGLFYTLTNVLITLGMILMLSPRSPHRVPAWLRRRLGIQLRDESGTLSAR